MIGLWRRAPGSATTRDSVSPLAAAMTSSAPSARARSAGARRARRIDPAHAAAERRIDDDAIAFAKTGGARLGAALGQAAEDLVAEHRRERRERRQRRRHLEQHGRQIAAAEAGRV